MSVATVKKALSHTWAKETDLKETYTFEFGDAFHWICIRKSAAGTRNFHVRYDVATGRAWWGQSYFLEVREIDTDSSSVSWYRTSDKDNAKKKPSFVWVRLSAGQAGSQPKSKLTPAVVMRAVAKTAKKSAAKDATESADRADGSTQKPPTSRDILRPPPRLHKAGPPHTPLQQPEIILDLEQMAVIYKPPQWKCELPAKDAEQELNPKCSQKGPQILLRWIKTNMLDIDACLFEEEFNPALSGTGFGPLSHRIDMETSGPLLVAKTIAAQRHLKAQFHQTSVSKQYVCLVHGKLVKPSGTIDAKIRTLRTENISRSEISSAGEWAQTDYEVIATYNSRTTGPNGDGYSLVACRIKTGRTHQIRVHMLHLGHPLVADDKYISSRDLLVEDRSFCPRLFLHCFRLGFQNRQQNPELVICPLPEDLKSALVRLGAADISPGASDLLFGETSWQRELFRPPLSSWRPGTRALSRVVALLNKDTASGPMLLSELREDPQLRDFLAQEGFPKVLGMAFVAQHCDVLEVVAAEKSDGVLEMGSNIRIRLRVSHAVGEAVGFDDELQRQLEIVRGELEDLHQQKQRAVAEENYARAAEMKKRMEAGQAELSSLQALMYGTSLLNDPETAESHASFAKEDIFAQKSQGRLAQESFQDNVQDKHAFPSLNPRPSVTTVTKAAEPAATTNTCNEDDTPPACLRHALVDFLKPREGMVAHINQINNDKFLRGVMAAQRPKVQAFTKTWFNNHEDTFAYLRTAENEVYVALKEAAQKVKSKTGKTAGAGSNEQPRVPAYNQVIQKTGSTDPKPLIYEYSGADKPSPESSGAKTWQDSFKDILVNLPSCSSSAENLLAAVPLFAVAMGARKSWEQRELLVTFLGAFPETFRIEKKGSGADRVYTIWAK